LPDIHEYAVYEFAERVSADIMTFPPNDYIAANNFIESPSRAVQS